MEFKTCEEYVLHLLDGCQNEVEQLKKWNNESVVRIEDLRMDYADLFEKYNKLVMLMHKYVIPHIDQGVFGGTYIDFDVQTVWSDNDDYKFLREVFNLQGDD